MQCRLQYPVRKRTPMQATPSCRRTTGAFSAGNLSYLHDRRVWACNRAGRSRSKMQTRTIITIPMDLLHSNTESTQLQAAQRVADSPCMQPARPQQRQCTNQVWIPLLREGVGRVQPSSHELRLAQQRARGTHGLSLEFLDGRLPCKIDR